jgi:hypothetical protein
MAALRGIHNQGALVKSTLAIYITLLAVVVVAAAQILYWKLVVTREEVCADDVRDAGWLPEPVMAWPQIELETDEPGFAAEPVRVAEPALVAA